MVFRALFNKVKAGLAKTRKAFSGVASLFRLKGRVDQQFLQQLEEKLYLADVGPAATVQIVERVKQAFLDKEITGDVGAFVKTELKQILAETDNAVKLNPPDRRSSWWRASTAPARPRRSPSWPSCFRMTRRK
jgi:signal recognition particle GTPase